MEQGDPAIRLQVLGSLEVYDLQGCRLSVKGRSLLLRLWAAGREGISRTQAASDLWPEDGLPAAHAKLRVALRRLKQSLPEGIILERDGSLGLNLARFQCDLDEGIESLERVLDEVDPALGAAEGEASVRWIESPLLPDLDDAWLQSKRAEWDDLREEAAGCLVQQAKEAGRLDLVLAASQAGLTVNPTSKDLAEAGVLSLVQMGDLKAAAARLKAWERAARELEPQFAFSQRLRRLTLDSASPGGATEDQIDLAATLLERLIVEDPEAALEFLGHRLFRKEVQTKPEAALALLERALERSQLTNESSHRCLGRAALAAGLMQNHEKAVVYAEKALKLAQSLPLRKAILISLSFDYYWLGQSDEALRTVDEAIEAAERIGDRVDSEIAKCQRATFWMLEDRLNEAIEAFGQSVEVLTDITCPDDLPDMVVILHNYALALAHAGRWKEAEERLNQCQVSYHVHKPKHLLPLLTPLRGLTLLMAGDSARGAGVLAKGVALACRNRTQRQIGLALLMAAMALVKAERLVSAGVILAAAEAELIREKTLPSKPRTEWIARLKPRVVPPCKSGSLLESCRLAITELRQIESGG